MSSKLFKITCLTNLSVGNGETNFSIIDNEVEKDPVTNLPVINSSGVKGAFREFFKSNDVEEDTITKLFGSDVKSSNSDESSSTPGSLKFLDAQTIALPCRASNGNKAYYMVIPALAIDTYNEIAKACDFSEIGYLHDENENHTEEDVVGIEGIDIEKKSTAKSIFGIDQYVILDDSSMKKINLPVLARNQLENGKSNNLWYEEVVPHKTIMYFAVLGNDDDIKTFSEKIIGNVVQFGGNASIGRGLCLVEEITEKEE